MVVVGVLGVGVVVGLGGLVGGVVVVVVVVGLAGTGVVVVSADTVEEAVVVDVEPRLLPAAEVAGRLAC